MLNPFKNKSVLITGGTGSLGKALMQQILDKKPKRIIVFSRDELKQSEMARVYPDTGGPCPVRYFIGDVRDKERLQRAFSGIDIVIHAAAMKQVPACEYNPIEAVQTNIFGTMNVIDAALDSKVDRVLLISSDKATNPINLYGSTKLTAEKLFVQANSYSGGWGTRFSVCRYGNVMGSRGSVIPVFQEQAKTGNLTITDRRMTRFWITMQQAVVLVENSLNWMQGGEIFIPKIPSMRVVDLAEAVAPGCSITEVGIRPGEKVNEILLNEDEARHAVDCGDHYLIYPLHSWWKADVSLKGKYLSDGFRYSSDCNLDWLSVEDMRSILTELVAIQ